MGEHALPAWTQVAEDAGRLRLAATPAELHGALSGWLAGGGDAVAAWLAPVLADPGLPPPPAGGALDRLRTATVAQLDDPAFGFGLLLPAEAEASTAQRADALFAWCRGFLGGFGLAHGDRPLGEDDREALADIARLASARIDAGDPEEDAASLAEIEEYLRMAVLLLHADCARRVPPRGRLH